MSWPAMGSIKALSQLKELKYHGVEMAGPTDSLRRAGNRGRHEANLARDFCRQVGGKVPWINHTVVQCLDSSKTAAML